MKNESVAFQLEDINQEFEVMINQEAFPGRGGDRRKVVGGFGIGIGTTCRSVDGFKRGLRLRLLPE